MYEAMNGGVASHVFLLDDDVVVEPEGLRRAIVMASLTPQPTLVGAHMLERLRPTTLWTTGEVLDPLSFAITASDAEAGYRIDLEEYRQESVVTSAFNGWWSCLIPIEAVERVGMSLPFFIKWDDIEYGYRAAEAGYPTITLPGAAVWHESWDTKDDVDNWTLYFTVRNRLIHTAMESARLKPADRQKRARSVLVTIIRHDLLVFLSRRMYANASAVVAALNDFASGTLVLEEKSLTEQVAQVRAARKGFPDIPVSFPTDRLQALDGYVEPKSRRKALTLPLAIGSELVAGEPDDQWRLRRTIRTAVDIGAVGNVGLEVLPKANDRWWSILDRDDVYVSTIDGKAMSRRRRDSKLTRKLLAEGLSAARKAQKAIVENSADWASKREMLCSPEWWAKAFEQAEVPAEPNRGQQ
jgi:galactofuranosylgalactofuranosylrhamnosyl-N-acetylglucosaminyl-diphospho-decaprenol beta-1,5/1,6-galactofuranosyltransferase